MRLRSVLVASVLALLLTPAAQADPILDSVGRLAQSGEQAAFRIAGTAVDGVADAAAFAGGLGGPFGQAIAHAGQALQEGLSRTEGEFLALGEGDITIGPQGDEGGCPAAKAILHVHEPMSNEPRLTASFGPSQGNPALVCANGWRFTFKPEEVSGDEQQGWQAYRLSPDAEIWFTMGPAAPDGTRAVEATQVTVFGDVFHFDGRVAAFA